MSAAPEKRRAVLSCASGKHLHLEYVCWVENAHQVEKATHEALKKWRRRGEWFACKLDLAIEAVESVIAQRAELHEVTLDIRWLADRIREATRLAPAP
jgi:hypothetical protein